MTRVVHVARCAILLGVVGGCSGSATETSVKTTAPDERVQDESEPTATEGSDREADSTPNEDMATGAESTTPGVESSMDRSDDDTGGDPSDVGEPSQTQTDPDAPQTQDPADAEDLADSPNVSRCDLIDGKLAYGPIGDPIPLPVRAAPSEECANCNWSADVFGFRSSSGYDFVWRSGFDAEEPTPNLYSLSLDPNFGGGEPRALPAGNSVHSLQVAPTPQGYLATICSSHAQPSWLQLNAELAVTESPVNSVPEVAPESCALPVVWTGKNFMSAAVDSRGLTLSIVDEQGSDLVQRVIDDTIVSAWRVRLSANGDRVLVAYYDDSAHEFRYALVDREGALVTGAQLVNEYSAHPLTFSIVTSGSGWTITSGYASHSHGGVQVTQISRGGANLQQVQASPGGYLYEVHAAPSAYGGVLVTGARDTGGQFGSTYWLTALVDDSGEAPYQEDVDVDEADFGRRALIHDPDRDLVMVWPKDGESLLVQEYGCLE